MATTYRVLGQIYPSASTLTTAYTVPALTSAIVSTICVSNQTTVATSYRISVEPSGNGSTVPKNYIAKDSVVSGLENHYITIGITLASGDIVKCYSESGQVSFNLFGSEIA